MSAYSEPSESASGPEIRKRWLVPKWILKHPAISSVELALWLVGTSEAIRQRRSDAPERRDRFKISVSMWARKANVTRNTVKAIIKKKAFLFVVADREAGLYDIEKLQERIDRAKTKNGYIEVSIPPVDLKPGPLRLWCAFHEYWSQGKPIKYSQPELAKLVCTSERNLRRWIRSLEHDGLIAVRRTPRVLVITRQKPDQEKKS